MKTSTKLLILVVLLAGSLFATLYWFPWEKPQTVADKKGLSAAHREEIDSLTKVLEQALDKVLSKKTDEKPTFYKKFIQGYEQYTRSPLWSEPRRSLNYKTVFTTLPNGQIRTDFSPSFDSLIPSWPRYWTELSVYAGIIIILLMIWYIIKRLTHSKQGQVPTT